MGDADPVQVSQQSSSFSRDSDRRLTSFSKESNEVGLFWSSVNIKLDELRMLEVRRPIVNFLPLGVLSNATPGGIHTSP